MLCFSFLFLKEIVSSDDKSSEEILEFKNRRRDFDAVGEEKEEEEKDISKRFEDNACIEPDRNPTRFRRSGAFVKYGRKETIRFGMENIFYDGRNIPSSPPFRARKTWSTVYSGYSCIRTIPEKKNEEGKCERNDEKFVYYSKLLIQWTDG